MKGKNDALMTHGEFLTLHSMLQKQMRKSDDLQKAITDAKNEIITEVKEELKEELKEVKCKTEALQRGVSNLQSVKGDMKQVKKDVGEMKESIEQLQDDVDTVTSDWDYERDENGKLIPIKS